MIVVHKIKMDLVRRELVPQVEVMQDDRYSRDLEIGLYANGVAFEPPGDCTVLVRFRKRDGTGGAYDTMPDGTAAWSVAGSTVTVRLAPQVCTLDGPVELVVALIHEAAELSCFPIRLEVRRQPEPVPVSRGYTRLTGYLPQPLSAQVGRYIQVTAVDDLGKVTAVEAVPINLPDSRTGAFYVGVISGDDGSYTADCTMADMDAAFQAGTPVFALVDGMSIWYPALAVAGMMWVFTGAEYGDTLFFELDENGYTIVTYDNDAGNIYAKIEDIPTTLHNPYALTINGVDYDGSKAVSMTVADSIPDYVRQEAARLAAVVQSRQNADTVSFLACADLHYSIIQNYGQQTAAMTHMGQAMGLIRKAVRIDFAAMLGDLLWDQSETAGTALTEMRFTNECLHDGFRDIPNFRCRGDHDNGVDSGADLSDRQIFASIGNFNAGAVYDSANRVGGYCYRDLEDRKLRVIALNSSEGGGCQFSQAQVDWLAGALDLSEKGDGWRSILLSHHPLDWTKNNDIDPITPVAAAEGLICSFHGHIHNFKTGTVTGTALPRIAIPNACFGEENRYGTEDGIDWSEETVYAKTAGTATDTAFCVVTIDLAERTIYADHYGAGYDRIVTYS